MTLSRSSTCTECYGNAEIVEFWFIKVARCKSRLIEATECLA